MGGSAGSRPLSAAAGDAGTGPAAGRAAASAAGPAAPTEGGPSLSPAPRAAERGRDGAGAGAGSRPGPGPATAAPGSHAHEHQRPALHPLLRGTRVPASPPATYSPAHLGRRKGGVPQRSQHLETGVGRVREMLRALGA